jgi:hypothetical protein
MKMNGKHELLAQIARRGLLLLGLIAVIVFGAGYSSAQTKAPAPSAVKADDAKTASPQAQTGSTQPAPAAEAKAAPRGGQEGIKVHGRWTIDVKNPDGSLARHVEFENGLCLNSQIGSLGGDLFLVQALAGQWVPGSWVVEFGTPAVPAGTPPPACGGAAADGLSSLPNVLYSLVQSGSAIQTVASSSVANTGYCQPNSANGTPAITTCFPGLTVQVQDSVGVEQLTLSGQFTVPSGAAATQITAVGTGLGFCISSAGDVTSISTPTGCFSSGNPAPVQFTGAYLTGTGSSPAPVSIGPNQLVSVTVQINFH